MTKTQVTGTNGRKTATLADVARLAGVSLSTASKALNGRDRVSEETRQRVVSSAEQLQFSPNVLARHLLSRRSGAIGLVTHDLEGRFSIPVLMGAEDAAGSGEVSVLLCDARGDTLRERHHIQALLGRRVDGLIVVGARTDPRPSLGRDLPVPVVYAYAPSDDPEDASVVSDNVDAGRMSAEHLLGCGRSRIVVISGDPTYGAAHDRVTGARQALQAAGTDVVGEPLFGAWTEEWGRTATRIALTRFRDVDAILCGSDQIARGALEVLRERALDVPRDVAVMGHDNWEVLATDARPPLTSVDMNLETVGRLAATRLFAAIEGRRTKGIEAVSCRLVPRSSTAVLD
jgi:LacI family transcriptional regulator